ncbi:MAG TPA: histidine--tRNA ligase [Candidatus Margulisiibacteriota bacterium]|nr:histidine--tRNA ligase [Candidatus Margulisiibacteriota bacterium]
MFKRIPGTKDILPDESLLWQSIEEVSRRTFSLYNYKEVRPPILEDASLFNRSLGESAEIVQKQLFLIKNKEDLYALRPEGTASVVRAYIENSLDKTNGFIKLYYIGPMFRFERPQKGRLRQFHHIGVEVIGSKDPALDAEVISLADNLLKSYNIGGYTIKLNSLGCPKDKSALTENLRKQLKGSLERLCPDCVLRFKNNPLRILDCKNDACKVVLSGIEISDAHLCPECKEHFRKVKAGLDKLGVKYEVVPSLVRGLDYYTGTVFEISHTGLGSQDALGAGGRYNNLVQELGGPDAGAIGFAFGVERLLLVVKPEDRREANNCLAYLITLGDEARLPGLKLLDDLRSNGIITDMDYEGKSLKAAMRKANDLGACCVLILGEDELKNNVVTLKNMSSGEQKQIKTPQLIAEFKDKGSGLC